MNESIENGALDTAQRCIMVGVDGSDYSSDALRLAGQLAAALDAPLEAVTCWGTLSSFAAVDLGAGNFPEKDQLEEQARQLVNGAAERAFGAHPPVRMEVTVRFGPTAKTLLHESRRARMLVVGRRGRGGFLGQVMGSVSSACAAHAHCPVVVVASEKDSAAPAGTEMPPQQ